MKKRWGLGGDKAAGFGGGGVEAVEEVGRLWLRRKFVSFSGTLRIEVVELARRCGGIESGDIEG